MKNKDKITDEVLCAEYSAVYRYVLSLCRDESLASDITQETFLKAMSAKKGFEGQSSLYTWLCSIAKRLWLNKVKKQGREVRDEDLFTDKISDYVDKFNNLQNLEILEKYEEQDFLKTKLDEFKEIFETKKHNNRYGNGFLRKVFITIERKFKIKIG